MASGWSLRQSRSTNTLSRQAPLPSMLMATPLPASAPVKVWPRLDRLHLEFPFAGSRMLRGLLVAEGCKIGRRHVKTLMQRMGIEALYRRPRTPHDRKIGLRHRPRQVVDAAAG